MSIVENVNQYLDVANGHIDYYPGWLVLAGHCAFCATLADDLRDQYSLHFWVTFLAGFGGGAISAVILGRPEDVPINLFVGHTDVIWVVMWWLCNYFPTNIPGQLVRFKPVKMALKLCVCILRSKTLCARVTQTLTYYPAAYVAAIIMGVIGGSGGKLIHDSVRGGYHLLGTTDEMRVPSHSLHSSTAMAVLYLWLVHIGEVFTAGRAAVLVTLILVVQTVIMDVSGVDILYPLPVAMHTIFNVPRPVSAANPKPAASDNRAAKGDSKAKKQN